MVLPAPLPAEPHERAGGADILGRHRRLGRRTALVSVLTLASRVLGYVREMLSAWLFGDSSGIYDAFITAWRVPNLFRRFLGEGALATSFQTALTQVDGDHGEERGRRLFWQTFRLLALLSSALCLLSVLAVLALPDAMPLTGWRWLGDDPGPVRELCARLLPFVVVVCLAALVGGALHVRGHFAAPAWAPATLNVVWIAVLVAIALHFGWPPPGAGEVPPERALAMTRWLAWGVLAAGTVQFLVQLPALARAGFLGAAPPRVRPPERGGGLAALDVLRRAVPLAAGAAIYQINVMVDGLMAEGLLPDGGPTLHYFANRVQQFPMALIAFAATAAVFPALQAHGHRGDMGAVRALCDRTQRAIAFIALPATVGLWVVAEVLVGASFGHGRFGAEGVERTTAALRMLTIAILPAGASGLVARTYYALGDFRSPVRISAAMLVLNALLNVVCIRGLGMDVDGLALATAVSSWATFLLLARGLGRIGLPPRTTPMAGPLARMVLAALVSGAAAAAGLHALLAAGRLVALLGAMGAGIAGYGLAAALLRVPELEHLRRRRGR